MFYPITFSFRQFSDKNDNNVTLTTANQVPASANKGSSVMNGQATTFKGVPGMYRRVTSVFVQFKYAVQF